MNERISNLIWTGLVLAVVLATILTAVSTAQIFMPHRHLVPMMATAASPYCISTALTNGLVSCWTLNETGNVTRADFITTNTLSTSGTGSTNGVISNAVWFTSGTDQRLFRADADCPLLSPGDTDFTVTVWAMLGSTNSTQFIVDKTAPTWEYGLHYLSSGNAVRWRLSTDGSGVTDLRATNGVNPGLGVWHFYVAWHDSTNDVMGIQVDNGVIDSRGFTGGVYTAGAAVFCLGNRSSAGSIAMTGRVDEVKYYNRLLTADEKTYLYNSGLGRSCCY